MNGFETEAYLPVSVAVVDAGVEASRPGVGRVAVGQAKAPVVVVHQHLHRRVDGSGVRLALAVTIGLRAVLHLGRTEQGAN
jgi:hypothetical protein